MDWILSAGVLGESLMKSRLRRRVLVSEDVSALFGFFVCFIGFFPLPWLYGPLKEK